MRKKLEDDEFPWLENWMTENGNLYITPNVGSKSIMQLNGILMIIYLFHRIIFENSFFFPLETTKMLELVEIPKEERKTPRTDILIQNHQGN